MKFSNIYNIEYQKKFPFVKISKENLFIIFLQGVFIAFVAFCLETVADYATYDAIYDRGFMTGPILIMYFFIIVISLSFVKTPKLNILNVIIFFFAIAIGICIIELIVGNVMEAIIHEKLWVYEGWLPLSWGYVSLSMAAIWGLIGVTWLYVVIPLMHLFFRMIPRKAMIPIIVILITLFIIDITYTSYKVIDQGKYIELYYKDANHRLSMTMIHMPFYFISIWTSIYLVYDLLLRRLKSYIYLPVVIFLIVLSLMPASYLLSQILDNTWGIIDLFAKLKNIPFYISYILFIILVPIKIALVIIKKRG